MQIGTLLVDETRGEGRFRVESLLVAGKSYQIALAADTHMDEKQVCVKVIEYAADRLGDAEYVRGRRAALKAEMAFLTLPSHLLPEPLDWLEIAGAGLDGKGGEPALVYEYQHGQTLHELVTRRHPSGMAPARALRILAELVRFAGEIHASGYIFRDFDPRHVIVGFDDILHMVGCGNAVERGEKMSVFKMNTNPCYTAPEIRHELSGKVVRPACDVYSLGCLLSFMLTGIEPRHLPESPLEADAYEQLREELEPGYRLLVARCLQPLAQKRFSSASAMLPYCAPEQLPEVSDPEFGMMLLPTPWSGPEAHDNRGVRSKLSPGPLISTKPSRPPATAPAAMERAQGASQGTALQAPQENEAKPPTALQKPAGGAKLALIVGGAGMVLLIVLAVIGAAVAMSMGLI